jgi:hypothetical protein
MEFNEEDLRGIIKQAAAWFKTNADTARMFLPRNFPPNRLLFPWMV